jgi:hypothetical protein
VIARGLLQLLGVLVGTMCVGVMSVFVLAWRTASWFPGTGRGRSGRADYAPAA